MTVAVDGAELYGRSGLRVSEVCLGTMMMSTESPSSAGPEESRRILEAFADKGGNYFDTANEVYNGGLSEQILGEFVASDRHRYVVTTKYTNTPAWVVARGQTVAEQRGWGPYLGAAVPVQPAHEGPGVRGHSVRPSPGHQRECVLAARGRFPDRQVHAGRQHGEPAVRQRVLEPIRFSVRREGLRYRPPGRPDRRPPRSCPGRTTSSTVTRAGSANWPPAACWMRSTMSTFLRSVDWLMLQW
ncbi:MAG: hypothetical protein F4Z04_04375 [Acidobacteria bacterium]|nr:hypothetical protein [Acidobacteriota bacterium]